MNILTAVLAAAVTSGQPTAAAPIIETQDLFIQFRPRSPEQIASFYIGRGFPKAMVDILMKQCFITTRVHNRSKTILWHDMSEWSFIHDGKALPRESRETWQRRWHAMDMPQPSISTFRWTQIPERLDFLPDEEEGGNIILPRVEGPISIRARFKTGEDGGGPVIDVRYDTLYCATDEAP